MQSYGKLRGQKQTYARSPSNKPKSHRVQRWVFSVCGGVLVDEWNLFHVCVLCRHNLHHESISVVPEYDAIPMVDRQSGLVQTILCNKSHLAMQNACHMLEGKNRMPFPCAVFHSQPGAGTICDLLAHCGDHRRRFTSCEVILISCVSKSQWSVPVRLPSHRSAALPQTLSLGSARLAWTATANNLVDLVHRLCTRASLNVVTRIPRSSLYFV